MGLGRQWQQRDVNGTNDVRTRFGHLMDFGVGSVAYVRVIRADAGIEDGNGADGKVVVVVCWMGRFWRG